jgi:hypothetical protein
MSGRDQTLGEIMQRPSPAPIAPAILEAMLAERAACLKAVGEIRFYRMAFGEKWVRVADAMAVIEARAAAVLKWP